MKLLHGLTIIGCVVSICAIVYSNSHYNNQKYEVVEIFGLPYGGEEAIWMEGDCVLLKDGKTIVSTSKDEQGKEVVITQKGVYKLIELKK